jgi:hypothetical protein
MAIRTKAVRDKGSHKIVRAITVTEDNVEEIVAWINRHGGAANGHGVRIFQERTRPARVRLLQRNYGENWGKRDWRVATVGDTILKIDFAAGEDHREKAGAEFVRVKAEAFAAEYVAA